MVPGNVFAFCLHPGESAGPDSLLCVQETAAFRRRSRRAGPFWKCNPQDQPIGRARRILPVVALSVGISDVAWAEDLEAQIHDICGLRALRGRPLMEARILGQCGRS